MPSPFKFRQFTIVQEKNPHKVGTDSVLLGAWTRTDAKVILDIGTGTGLLALMMAQNHSQASITALEPDEASGEEAKLNFDNSVFANRITLYQTSLQYFATKQKFDLIICNPPYFSTGLLSQNEQRANARHQSTLSAEVLYGCASKLLNESGTLNLIFPSDDEKLHFSEAALNKLFPSKLLRTIRPNGNFERTLVQYRFVKSKVEAVEMIVKNAANQYSSEYIEMTVAFYVKDLG